MFQAKKWSWKRVAANLLLVPLLAGGSVAVVQAQLGRSSSSAGAPQMPTTASSMPKTSSAPKTASSTPKNATGSAPASSAGDSKQFLKDGRKALAEGRFADAQDLAAKADNNNPSGKWGLFDDTPAALSKDIQAAQLKANKTQSEQLVKNAKALAAKPAENDAEKAYNLDNALQMARQAEKLHGPYTAWDWTDRADKLVKELEASRAKLTTAAKPPTKNPPANAVAKNPPANAVANNTQRPNTGTPPKPNTPQVPGNTTGGQQVAGADAKKATAQKLMAEGKALADQGQFAAAKAKYVEADNLKATFSPNEPNPGYSLRDLNARGAATIDQLVRDAMQATATKDYAKANAALTHAGSITGALGLHAKPVTEAKSMLWTASGGKYGAAAPNTAVANNTPNTGSPVGPMGTPPLFPPVTSGNLPVANNTPKPVTPGTQVANNTPKPVTPVVPGGQVVNNGSKPVAPVTPNTAVANNTPNTGSPVGPMGTPPLFPPVTSGNLPVANNTPKPVTPGTQVANNTPKPVTPVTPVTPVVPSGPVANNTPKPVAPVTPNTAVANNIPNTGSPVGPMGTAPLFPPSTSGNTPVVNNTPKPVTPVIPVTPGGQVVNNGFNPAMPVPQVANNTPNTGSPVGPMGIAPLFPPSTSGNTPVVNNTPKPVTPVVPGALTAKQLLDQATIEYEHNQFDVAETLALKAHNLGMQEDARALLNSIEAKKDLIKKKGAAEAVANAKISYDQKDYQRTIGVLVLVDRKHLTENDQKSVEQMLTACRAELSKAGTTDVVTTGGIQQPDMNPLPSALSPKGEPLTNVIGPKDSTNPPGKAIVNSDAPTSAADSLRSVQFQKLRAEGLRVLEEAQKAYGRGETDLAMQMLLDYTNLVRISGLGAGSISRLLLPVETRLDTFRMMKGQTETVAMQNKERREARERITNRGVAEEERKREVSRLMRDCNDLVKQQNYAKAEGLALQAKQLEPDEPAITAMLEMIKMTKRVKYAEDAKKQREEFFLQQMNNAEEIGPIVTGTNPVAVQLDALRRAQSRGPGDHYLNRQRSRMEYEIETKLENPISLELNLTPLNLAIQNFQTKTGLPVYLDQRSLDEERISSVQPITFEPGSAIAAKHVLTTILDQAGLSYVVEHDMVKITTIKKSKGRMVTKVFSVADLVTPVPNFALPDYANFDKMLKLNPISSGNLVAPGITPGFGATSPQVPPGGLTGGQPASLLAGDYANQAGVQPGIKSPLGQGGTLQPQMSPLAGSASVTNANNSKHEQLIKLITSMIRPYSWDGTGGGGKIEFFDIGSALVVNQTADVISEVSELLEALRRLQDLAIAVEVRIVSLAEAFFERMGVDFSINVKTHTTSFEPSLTGPGGVGPGTFRPQPFINDINNKGVTIGLTPAGSFTPDLDVPIRATSFQRGIPGFGNFPNNPGNNGGVSLGLAFLNDIQVYTFMEIAQGDMRSNIMQAPKLTLFNGQTSTLAVQNTEFFVTNVQVFSVNGQIVFIPQNTPLPGPGDFAQGGTLNITIQAVVSADRRFVRLNLPVTLSAQSGASVPLFPVTTFITPVFEGGSQGQPIPFTQFLQQPAFTTLTIQTTVVCPDGGTVLLGGLKTVRESRNEFGPPFLSKIPYFNRLFKNVGVGRDTRHIMIMVTPRIIINSEEEIFQTEGRIPGQGATP